MAKVLNFTKYHKVNVVEHGHHHYQQQQNQPIKQKIEPQLVLTNQNQQQKQRENNTRIHTNENNYDNNNNNKYIRFNNNDKNKYNEFINYKKFQQHVAEDQQPNFSTNNTHFQQLTSISSFSTLKNLNLKINSSRNINNTFPSLVPSSTKPSVLPPSATCSYSPAPLKINSSTGRTSSAVTVNPSALFPFSTTYFNPSSTYSIYSTCCVLTYNMFTAYAEAATVQLKRKTQFNKLLHVSGHPDMRSICYLVLMAFLYWGVIIRAAVATNLTVKQEPTSISHSEVLNMTAMFNSNITESSVEGMGEESNATKRMLAKSSLKFPVSVIPLDDTLNNYKRRLLMRREAANVPDFDDEDSSYHDEELDEYEILINNKSALGKYIGAPCNNSKCESTLLHVTCERDTNTCGCEKNYPVQLGLIKGCDKPKKIGEQCFYDETCLYNDENSRCVQVRHNAMCQCASGFHSVSYTKPTRRVFCTQDIDELNSDLPTLLGVCVGIGVLAGLICMVLHLFSKTKYPRHRNFGDANLPPPIMYSSETGIPLTVQSGRPSSRSSIRSSGGSIGSYGNRRSSTGGVGGNNSATTGSKGILVSTSRTGSRRPSLASVHSTSSSVRSYSMMRFEKEQQQKEIRQEMKLRLARLQHHQHQQHLSQYKPQIIIGDAAVTMQHGIALNRITMATPSPITPNSTDELLPAVDESQEYQPKSDILSKPLIAESVASASISSIKNVAASSNMTSAKNAAATASSSPAKTGLDLVNAAAYIGPCSFSNEAL